MHLVYTNKYIVKQVGRYYNLHPMLLGYELKVKKNIHNLSSIRKSFFIVLLQNLNLISFPRSIISYRKMIEGLRYNVYHPMMKPWS